MVTLDYFFVHSAEPEWVDVVIDLLLSLLSQQNKLVRVIVNTVFSMLCPHLSKKSLQLIIEVSPDGDMQWGTYP